LNTSDFTYTLPPSLIAQHPAEKRDESRLLVVGKDGSLTHERFYNIINYIKPADTLVVNDSRVIPARIFGSDRKGRAVEFLLLRDLGGDVWESLVKPGKHAKIGDEFDFSGIIRGEIIEICDGGTRKVKFTYSKNSQFLTLLDEIGAMPLPPYITERLDDKSRYQTVYAKEPGSAAAPTAGLHFTDELLAKIAQSGTEIVRVMLHVGLGTFRPVKVENVEEHKMHSEFFTISQNAADIINSRRAAGGKTIAVGTTSCRVLESASDEKGILSAQSRETDIFIRPPYKFRAVDALITNFHLPESTLLMLVSAFSGKENILNAYKTAVDMEYRFFSFGDAMLLT
jgi:S-adenosylmethionine:tRNA ribosyltransferase-isomerase